MVTHISGGTTKCAKVRCFDDTRELIEGKDYTVTEHGIVFHKYQSTTLVLNAQEVDIPKIELKKTDKPYYRKLDRRNKW